MTTRSPVVDALPDAASLRRPASRRLLWVLVLTGGLVVVSAASVAFGTRDVSLTEIASAFSGGGGVGEAAVIARVPRTVLGLLVGAALAMAGLTMQAVTRNPLADPGILGVSAGAALAVVTGIAFFGLSSSTGYMGFAIVGAAVAAVFVYIVGSLGRGGATPLKLALAGAATTAAFGSLSSAILLPRVDLLEVFRFWQIGGIGGATWERVQVVLPVLAMGALVCVLCSRGMNSLALGDDVATGLGEHVGRTRLIASAGAVVLVGAATAVAGPIAFVGLVVPHVCRMLIGTDHRWLVPFSALGGAILLVGADVVGRLVARPTEVEVGILTALIGAPFFIWIVRRQKVREL
ncbi:FecCD family ABC transporter permease [Microbacterium sp. Leaf151]|uniref:FecCD family ABC transporter permease n=1 Tax=Microbacterium sp. Leaf151 TaxID=1736276 RepID=UPI0006F61BB2|nr:iron ABC transporter permease [Microbacterium sp. Leaf151]KQR25409.1 iron ABC transporter permease [Microbacterium sp. Leaf151]